MNKRLSIRLVKQLADKLKEMSVERGTSMNSLISQILWDFIENYYKEIRG